MLNKIIFYYYFFVFQIEFIFFSYSSNKLKQFNANNANKVDTIKADITFDNGIKLKHISSKQSQKIFESLLLTIKDKHLNLTEEKANDLTAKIYYHLGTLSKDDIQKMELYKKCIELLPKHSKAKDRLAQIKKREYVSEKFRKT